MKKIMIIASLLIVSTAQTQARENQTMAGTPQKIEHVSFQASELSSVEGLRGLRSRIRKAALRVCYPAPSFIASFIGKSCYEPALKEALAQLDHEIARRRTGSFAGIASLTVRAR